MILRALLSSLVCVVVNGFWEEMYVMYADNLPNLPNYTGPYVFANQTDRQHLHYRRPPTNSPTIKHPTYFFAHGNNGTADGMRMVEVAKVIEAGYAVISWESLTSIGQVDNDTAICWSDHQLVMKWAVDNADRLQLDTTRFVIGGRSRGSVCSWPVAHGVAYTGDLVVPDTYSVIGIHMYNALPISNDEWAADKFPVTTVGVGSPRLQFNYGPNCTGGPVEDGPATCRPPNLSPNPTDIHNPWHGQKILMKYASLGIGGKANLTLGLEDEALADPDDNITLNTLFNFPEFAATLVPPSECAPALEWACPGYATYDFPAKCGNCSSVQHHKDVLIEANCTFDIVYDLCLGGTNNLDTQAAKAAQEAVSKSMADWAKPAPAPTDGSGAATDNTKNKVSAGHKSVVAGNAAAFMVAAAVVGKVLA